MAVHTSDTSSGDAAELSSLTTGLDDLAGRITAMAERRLGDGDDPDEVAARLVEVERSLRDARRRLARVADLL